MVESHPTGVIKMLDQFYSSAVNIDKSKSMPSVKGMDPDEASLVALCLPPEEGISQVGETEKVIDSISSQYLTELMLDVIRDLEIGTQEMSTS